MAPAAFAAHGARFLARGGACETLEGEVFERHVVIEFADLATAKACYTSSAYQAARAGRQGACRASIVIVDGLDPA